MKCPVCAARIDDDARFCDQCGVELFRCPRCGTAGRGPVCVKDGVPLGRFARVVASPVAPQEHAGLVLSNRTLNLRLDVQDGDILGRREGRHVNVLAGLTAVSGRHAVLKCTADGTWTISDLSSTNGTMTDGVRLTPHTPVTLRKGSRVVIANIEFEVTSA